MLKSRDVANKLSCLTGRYACVWVPAWLVLKSRAVANKLREHRDVPSEITQCHWYYIEPTRIDEEIRVVYNLSYDYSKCMYGVLSLSLYLSLSIYISLSVVAASFTSWFSNHGV